MCRPKTNSMARPVAAAAAAVALGAMLGGCSDIYFDHRQAISVEAGDAVAANQVTQMIDPWPASSGNQHIGFNGQRMQAAVERYRTNKVTPVQDSLAPSASTLPAQNVTQVSVGGGTSTAGGTTQTGDTSSATTTTTSSNQ
jgi:hypothetical protein